MRVVTNAPAPKTSAETPVMAAGFQTLIDFAVRKAGFNPVMGHIRRGKNDGGGSVPVPRVYIELTHPDTWTVNSNDPEHPELEEVCKAAIEEHIATCKASLEAILAELRQVCENPRMVMVLYEVGENNEANGTVYPFCCEDCLVAFRDDYNGKVKPVLKCIVLVPGTNDLTSFGTDTVCASCSKTL